MRVMEAGRGRKGSLEGITLGSTRTWAQVEDGKEGKQDGGRQAGLARGNTLVCLAWEGSKDERWWPAGGSAVQVDDRFATGRERGGGRSG